MSLIVTICHYFSLAPPLARYVSDSDFSSSDDEDGDAPFAPIPPQPPSAKPPILRYVKHGRQPIQFNLELPFMDGHTSPGTLEEVLHQLFELANEFNMSQSCSERLHTIFKNLSIPIFQVIIKQLKC